MKKWILGATIALAVLVLIVAGIGVGLPQGHVASSSASIARPPAEVFALITDFERAPDWRSDVARVEMLGEVNGRTRFREHSRGEAITFEVVELVAPSRLQLRIADEDLPFGGSWTYELTEEAGGTRIVITERGEVYNPIFRFVSRFVMGHTATITAYLDALGRKLGTVPIA